MARLGRQRNSCLVSVEQNDDETYMATAIAAADSVRGLTAPNPWVGAVIVTPDGHAYEGATQPDGGSHAEAVALATAGNRAEGATLYVTLEPCRHVGRNPPCVDALRAAKIARVVVGIVDPDERVNGRGIEQLNAAGIEVTTGVLAETINAQLAPYLKQRRTGRPFVILKLAATLDGRIAAPDGSSKWITGEQARHDVHVLRSRCDAIVVGAGTVRADDPSLTVRLDPTQGRTSLDSSETRQPLRVVLGDTPADAKVQPAISWNRDLEGLLDHLGSFGVLQVLIEGGAHVAGAFHRAGLVDRYVLYFASALLGGDDGVPMLAGRGASTMTEIWRGELLDVVKLGQDVKIVVGPTK